MEQVVCIRADGPYFLNREYAGEKLIRGSTYNVVLSRMSPQGIPTVILDEISTGLYYKDGSECGFVANRFVPIKDENLEVFRAIDRKIFDKKKVCA